MNAAPGPPRPREQSHFEQALVEAMDAATRGVAPAAVDVARIARRAQAWRSASVVAFVTSGVFLVGAAAAGLVRGDLAVLVEPAEGPAVAQAPATVAGLPASADDTTALGSPASASSSTAGTEAATTDEPTALSPEPAPTGVENDDQRDDDQQANSADADRDPACTPVADGSTEVLDLALLIARRQVDDWVTSGGAGGNPPGWLLEPSDEDLLERLNIAEAIDDVERDDIIDCEGQLRFASNAERPLDQAVERSVAQELADTLPKESNDDDDDDDDDD